MNSGKILAAEIGNIPILKFVGDVRVLLSATIDNYFAGLYKRPILNAMLVDLSEAEAIDSTALGMIAKMAIQLRNRFNVIPIIYSTNPDITRILYAMSLDLICDITDEDLDKQAAFDEVKVQSAPDRVMKQKVIEAHQTLMNLSEENKLEFQDLVSALKND